MPSRSAKWVNQETIKYSGMSYVTVLKCRLHYIVKKNIILMYKFEGLR